MGFVIAAIVIAVVAIVVVLIVLRQRRASDSPTVHVPAPVDASPPMTGLEAALDQAIDSSGRPLRDRLDDEQVDDLRVPDDTGPLLRRALDHVGQMPEETAAPADDGAPDGNGRESA